jgi:hypothetical protein
VSGGTSGTATGGKATGGTATGGTATGGKASGGTGTGGKATGGTATGGAATGGSGSITPCTPGTRITTCTNGVSSNYTHNCRILLGKYWVWNNLWGNQSATDQAIWATCNNGSAIGWGTSYNKSGAANSVKSYDSGVLGWHWGWDVSQAQTGLPIQISSNRTITCDWRFQVTSTGTVTQNGAYDLWVHSVANPTYNTTPTDEIMIWLYRSNNAGPISNNGTPIQNVSLGGTTWTLHRGIISGQWNVWSYVRNTNATSATLNLNEFLQDLMTRGYVQSSKYLASIEAGTEVFIGQGQFDTTSWGCTIQ